MRQGAFQRVRPARGGNRRRARTTVGVVLAATLTACSAGPGDVPEPVGSEAPPTPSPTATAAPESEEPPEPVTAPERPPEMDQADEAGAIAAAEYFLKLSEHSVQSGQLDAWRQVTTQDCRYCSFVVDSVEATAARGGRLVGGDLTVNSAELTGSDPGLGVFAVSVEYEATALVELAADGRESPVTPAGTGVLTLEVTPTASGWRLLGVVSANEP